MAEVSSQSFRGNAGTFHLTLLLILSFFTASIKFLSKKNEIEKLKTTYYINQRLKGVKRGSLQASFFNQESREKER